MTKIDYVGSNRTIAKMDNSFPHHSLYTRCTCHIKENNDFLPFSVRKITKSLSKLLREKFIFDFDVLDKIRLNKKLANEEIYRIVYCWLKNNISENQIKEGWSVLKNSRNEVLRTDEFDFILMLSMAELYLKEYRTNDVQASEMELVGTIVNHLSNTEDNLMVCFDLLTIARKSLVQCIIKKIIITKLNNITEEEIGQVIYAYELMTMSTKTGAESLWTDIATKFGIKEYPCFKTFSYYFKEFITIMDLSHILQHASLKLVNCLYVKFLLSRERNFLFNPNSRKGFKYLEVFILDKYDDILGISCIFGKHASVEQKKIFIRCCRSVLNLPINNQNNYDKIWTQEETCYRKEIQLKKELEKRLMLVFFMLVLIMICSPGQNKSAKLKKYLTLKYEFDKSVLYLLWCSGDIEINPGPPLKTKQLHHDSEKVRHWILNIVPILLKLYWKHTGNSVPKNLWQQKPLDWSESKPFYDTKNKTKDENGRTLTDTDLLECILECCHMRQVQLPQQIQDEISGWENGNLQLLFKLYILRVELDKICSSIQEVVCNAEDNDLQQKLTEKGISLNIQDCKLSLASQDNRNINITREIAIILCKIVNDKDPTKKCEGIWDQPPDGWPSNIVLFDPNNRAKYKKKYPDKELCSDKKIVDTFLQLPIFPIKMAMEKYVIYKPLIGAYQALVRCNTAKEAKKCKEHLHHLFNLHTNTMTLDFSLTYLYEAGLFDQEIHAILTHWWTSHKVDPSDKDKLSNVQTHGERPRIYIDIFQDSIRVSIHKQDVKTNVTIGYTIPFKNSKQVSGFSTECDVSQNQLQIQPSIRGTLSITSYDTDSQPSSSKSKDAPISNSKNHPSSDILQTHTHLAPRILDNAITNLSSKESHLKSFIESSQSGTQSCFSTRIAQSHYQIDISKGITFNTEDLYNQPSTSKDVTIPSIPSNINNIKEGEHTVAAANIDNQSCISNGFCIKPSYSIGQPKLKFVCDKLISTNHTTENATRHLDNCDQSRPSKNLQNTTDLNSPGNSGENGSDRNPENGKTVKNVTVKKRKNSETEGSSDCQQKLRKIEKRKSSREEGGITSCNKKLQLDQDKEYGEEFTTQDWEQVINDFDSDLSTENNINISLNNIEGETASEDFDCEQINQSLENFLQDLIDYESGKYSEIDRILADQT